MEIDMTYAALERITYKLFGGEIRRALIEYVKRKRQGKVPQGGDWGLESWDDDEGHLVVELTQELRKKVVGPVPDDKH